MATKSPSLQSSFSAPDADMAHRKSIRNTLLLALSPKDCDSIFERLEWVDLPVHTVLREPGEPMRFGYFIDSGLVSITSVMSDGKSVLAGLTGREGFVGMSLLAGYSSSPTRGVMQVAGSAFRIRAQDCASIARTCIPLANSLQRYFLELSLQSTQLAACNCLHKVESRLARCLLMAQDRIGSNDVRLTQETLAHMLGARRASVTVAAGSLQGAGLIRYHRGKVTVTNRSELETSACECYQKMLLQSRQWQNQLDQSGTRFARSA